MATAVTADTYLQQIHTARTQLHECFRRAHELLAEREAHLLRELETIQSEHEARYNSQQDELQGLEASKQALKNNLRDNDLLNKAITDINHKMEEILKYSVQTISLRFQWNTDLDRDLQQAGEIITTRPANLTPDISRYSNVIPVIPKHSNAAHIILRHSVTFDMPRYSNVAPVIPKHSNVTPINRKHSNVTPIIPRYSTVSPVIPRYSTVSPVIPKHSNVSPVIPKHSNVAPVIPKHYNVSPVIPKHYNVSPVIPKHSNLAPIKHSNVAPVIPTKPDNLTHVIPEPAILDHKRKSRHVISCCKEGASPGELHSPRGIAVEPQSGRIYIADQDNNRVQVFTPDGDFSFMFSSNINSPHGICINNDTVCVSQRESYCVTAYKLDGEYVNMVGSYGTENGQFKSPRGLAINPTTGHLYVCDTHNHRVQIFAKDLKFHSIFYNHVKSPMDIKFTSDSIIVLDAGDPCIHIFNITDHSLLNSVISRGAGGQMSNPLFFTMDVEHNLVLTDYDMHCIRKFNVTGKLKAKIGQRGYSAGEFINPTGIAIDKQNRKIVVSENKYASLQIF